MIIDKVEPYWKDEERERLAEIDKEREAFYTYWENRPADAQQAFIESDKWGELQARENEIYAEVEARYMKATRTAKAMLADVTEIVDAIEKSDFLEFLTRYRAMFLEVGDRKITPPKEYTEENFDNCYYFILRQLRVQLNFFADNGDDKSTNKCIDIVEKRVLLWYVKKDPNYLAMVHSNATDAFSFADWRNAKTDPLSGNVIVSVKKPEAEIIVSNVIDIGANATAEDILLYGLYEFTRQNDFKHKNRKEKINRNVIFPWKELARLEGCDLEERQTTSPEEAEKEKKRLKKRIDHAREDMRKGVDLLRGSGTKITEIIKGKPESFLYVNYFETIGMDKKGNITMEFTNRIAEALASRNTITLHSVKLMKLDKRKTAARSLGKFLENRWFMDNNIRQGTRDRISIKELLPYTKLIEYSKLQTTGDRGKWEKRIKEPLENALDELKKIGFLKDWRYTHAKAVELTETEAYNIETYADFESLYLHYELTDDIDQTERLERKNKQIAERLKKTEKKKNGGKQ